MKKLLFGSTMMIGLLALSGTLQAQDREGVAVVLAEDNSSFSYSLDAMAVINNKCFGCHSPKGRSDDAREALQWIELQNMDKSDLIGNLDEIVEVLEEGEMPPAKIVEKYPHMKLSEEEAATLKEWAEAQLTALMDE